jgi:hypothetical protein
LSIYNLVFRHPAGRDGLDPAGITMGQLGQISRDYMKAHSGDSARHLRQYYIHGLGTGSA